MLYRVGRETERHSHGFLSSFLCTRMIKHLKGRGVFLAIFLAIQISKFGLLVLILLKLQLTKMYKLFSAHPMSF